MVKNGTCVDKIRRRILASNRANPTTKKHSPHDGSNLDARTKRPDDDEKRLFYEGSNSAARTSVPDDELNYFTAWRAIVSQPTQCSLSECYFGSRIPRHVACPPFSCSDSSSFG